MNKRIPLIGQQFLISADPLKYEAAAARALMLQNTQMIVADILYHMPDRPAILQTFIWQNMDLVPEYPALRRFLNFWDKNLDGKLHSVQVAGKQLIKPSELRHAMAEFSLN